MTLFGSIVVVFSVLAVGISDKSSAHKDLRATDSVRNLKANETVHDSGSDFVFTWTKCVICDGYDARLYLEDLSGTRIIPHQLKAAVTSLKITNVPPRTAYRLFVRRSASDVYGSEVSGRSFSKEAPLPVDNLRAWVLANSSIQIEWNSRSADGFVARVLERNILIQERVLPDFSNRSVINVTNLKPDTEYLVQVLAYYFPPTESSSSAISSIHIKTLPIDLPRLHLSWKFDSELQLFWENPQTPKPAAHKLSCAGDARTLIDARFSGDTDLVALSSVAGFKEIDCVLETWFSMNSKARIFTNVIALRKEQAHSTFTDLLQCNLGLGGYSKIEIRMTHNLEYSNEIESVVLKFKEAQDRYRNPLSSKFQVQYRLCEQAGSCSGSWTTLLNADSRNLRFDLSSLKAWIPYTVQYRYALRCGNSDLVTTARSLEIPGLAGPVDPVTDIVATLSGVSWKYAKSSAPPSYFLVTHCSNSDCTSQNVPGSERSLSLEKLRESAVYYVTIQAVQLRADRVYVSSTEITSIIVPRSRSSDHETQRAEIQKRSS